MGLDSVSGPVCRALAVVGRAEAVRSMRHTCSVVGELRFGNRGLVVALAICFLGLDDGVAQMWRFGDDMVGLVSSGSLEESTNGYGRCLLTATVTSLLSARQRMSLLALVLVHSEQRVADVCCCCCCCCLLSALLSSSASADTCFCFCFCAAGLKKFWRPARQKPEPAK